MIGRALDRLADVVLVYALGGRPAVGRYLLGVVHEACARSYCPAAHRVAEALEDLGVGR